MLAPQVRAWYSPLQAGRFREDRVPCHLGGGKGSEPAVAAGAKE